MARLYRRLATPFLLGIALFAVTSSGCLYRATHCPGKCDPTAPRESATLTQATHIIDPPDILQIDAIRLVPRPPYRVEPLDSLSVQFPADPTGLPKKDVEDLTDAGRVLGLVVTVEPDGAINLGPVFGRVTVADKTLEEAKAAVTARIMQFVKKELVEKGKVAVDLAQTGALQQIKGDHLVRPDGTVSLGSYGFVRVAGLTQEEAKSAIEAHLSAYLLNPKISLDVTGYNSKVFYVIFDGGGNGEQVTRLPITGKDTVLDALGTVGGLPPVACRKLIWVARPVPGNPECHKVMPVDWKAITRCASTTTNYQVFPGDRIYVQADPFITADTYITRIIAPFERMFGFALLGNSTVINLRNSSNTGGFIVGSTNSGIINPIVP